MTGDTEPEVEGRDEGGSNTGLPADHPATEYCLAVVRHRNRADECTVCPRCARSAAAYGMWITVDRDAVIDLEAHR